MASIAPSIDEKAVITTTTRSGSCSRTCLQDLHAGDAGQHEVEQDEVDLLALEQRQRLLAGARHDRFVALLAHQRG